ncbi:uncharacterized protein C8Q71DRAFT_854811 [Rhodofomes roseus]|uniref:Polyketide synthase-like phosphopantetheine-binding domain-containing protein n=1 Tax=Rhodofomes roseus TaxID=34475 RepID=A0ABQ8KQR6_9APHY|nr:uncharacterized protein C8Q71DRAFT_854811 [Rhodofomes roseus]KAH9840963.1 hypothetical protein C8Q71DRAFT_854811 [Rhodofomes roseus]
MAARTTFPAWPQTQALSSATFKPPPLDGSLTLPEIYDWHFEHTPNHRLFVFDKEDGTLRTIYWPEAVTAINVGAKIIRDRMGWKPNMEGYPVVAILSPSDSIPYFTLEMSIMRAGYVVFPLSPRNSPAAIAHLVVKANVKHILVGREKAMTDLASSAFDILKAEHPSTALPDLSPMLSFEELYLPPGEGAVSSADIPYRPHGSDDPAMLLHSSGSTAFPKPIVFTYRRMSQLCLQPYFAGRDLADKVFSMHVMPMFHGMGVCLVGWAASCGLVLSAFRPQTPPPPPSPEAHFRSAHATESDIIFAVPAIIEAWSRIPDHIAWLATRSGVLYGGGPLNRQVGDYLTSQGVSIFILYGSTEGSIMSPILPAEVGYDWDYFKFPPFLRKRMEPFGENTYEFVLVANEFCTPGVINTKVDGVDAYASSDLFTEHPSKPDYWKVYGRSDDQIIHSTGEKTNPGPLESMLNQDPYVQSAVMFGRGHFQAGVIVDPKPQFKFDPADEAALAVFRNNIWPTIEKMNAFAPQHSRLFKEMILVSKPSKPFTYTAKGTARRQAIIIDYEPEIERLYQAIEESTQSSIAAPRQWDVVTTTDFVRAVVGKVLVHSVQDTDDLFQHGCDSLQATWIRNSLLRALRDSAQLDTRKVARNFVYEYPTVASLATYLSSLAFGAGDEDSADQSEKGRVKAMRAMVEAYSKDFPTHQPSPLATAVPRGRDVVLLTGTTGSLGCHILAQLIADPGVTQIYALNRPSKNGQSLRDRQKAAAVDRGLDVDIDGSGKVTLLEADLTLPQFGLTDTNYQEMRNLITHIIHNAWRVDFNLSLASFESNVKGLRRLIDFALSSLHAQPPQLTFTSTIGIFHNVRNGDVQKEDRIEPELAAGIGYTESKWVSEEILRQASGQTALTTVNVRVGQVCGGVDGAWNASEWFPSLVQSVEKLKCFPNDPRAVDWIQLDVAGAAVADFRKLSRSSFVHLVHPRPVPWSAVAETISAELSVDLVPYEEWLAKLEQHDAVSVDERNEVEHLRAFPALRLLPFFKSIPKALGSLALGFSALDVAQAVSASPTLANPMLRQVGEGDVKKWLAYWRKVGLLTAA